MVLLFCTDIKQNVQFFWNPDNLPVWVFEDAEQFRHCSQTRSMYVCVLCVRGKWKGKQGIQFLVLADQVVVHLFVCCFEVIHIWLIRCGTRKLHMRPCPKRPHIKSTFAVKWGKKNKKKTKWNYIIYLESTWGTESISNQPVIHEELQNI